LSAVRAELAELHRQLAERKTVERAKGILMQVRGLSEGEAYRLLRRESQNRRRSLREVASSVVQMEAVFRASGGK
ncbi:MAG: ANTAR domain-containing protein, partial [Gemmatimonadota bacterium]|nr:ANTAR domain-containing protein [Gemmatimonadota bacterium]